MDHYKTISHYRGGGIEDIGGIDGIVGDFQMGVRATPVPVLDLKSNYRAAPKTPYSRCDVTVST